MRQIATLFNPQQGHADNWISIVGYVILVNNRLENK
jgi:hypothetical protein